MSRKRIVFFIGGLSGGGAERVTCNLANYFLGRGYNVDVITMSDEPAGYCLDKSVQRIILLKKNERKNKICDNLLRNKRLKKYVKDNQDVSCYIVMLPITIFMLARLKKYTKSKVIMAERCNPGTYNLAVRMMMRHASKRCNGIVVQTKEIGDWYSGVRKKYIIPNAINEDVALPERTKNEKRIVAVGRLTKQKNYPMMIKAFSEFNKKRPDYILEIYGQGAEEKKIRKMIVKYGLDDKVRLKGYVKNVSEQIVNATCFVMTSDYEGMSNALIEAMCLGLPCIATDCNGGGARALIKNNENGILIEKENVGGLNKALDRIVENSDFADTLSKNALRLKNELNCDKIYSRWNETVKDIVDEK